ncbi:acyl-CoA dehydrogenase domain protein, partial [Vibrio parahaemolyticus V-223/04]
APLVRRSKL